jgi:hypothetical protein
LNANPAAVDLRAVGMGEGHEREHVDFGTVLEFGEIGELAAQLIGHGTPQRARRVE